MSLRIDFSISEKYVTVIFDRDCFEFDCFGQN